MVGLPYFPKSPSLDSLLQQQPMNSRLYSSSSSHLNHHHHHHQQQQLFLSLTKLQLKPMLSNLGFRPRRWSLTHCTWVNSPRSSEAENGTLVSFFGELGIDEKETKALLVKNSAILSSSIKSLRSRVLSLSSLGIEDSKISLIISKRPSIVTSEEVDPFVAFVLVELGGEIKASQLERLFLTLNPSLLSGFDRKVKLLIERGIPRDMITRVLNAVNLSKAICSKPLEELDETIAFLTRFGGVDLLVKRPTLLNYPLETHLVPRIGFFSKLIGGDEASVGAVLGKLPAVLNYTVGHFESHAEFFRSTLGSTDEEIFKLVLTYPNVFSASRARKLAPRTQFLRDCGLGSEEIYKFLMRAPLFLSLSFDDNVVHKLALLVKIGYEPRTRELAAAMGSVTRTSCRNMLDVIGVFLSHGFSCEDILSMSKRHPQILQYSHESLDEKMEYLFGEMGRGIEELLAFPAFLGYKLDERIKARYEARKNTSREGMSINKLLTVSSERFSKRKKKTVDCEEIF